MKRLLLIPGVPTLHAGHFLKCVVHQCLTLPNSGTHQCSAQNVVTRYPQKATVSHLCRSPPDLPRCFSAQHKHLDVSSTAHVTEGEDMWMAMICSSHGKAATGFPDQGAGKPSTPRPTYPRGVGLGSFLLWLFPTLFVLVGGLLSHLWQVEERRFMQHVLLLWE